MLAEGRMPVRQLAPALLSLGELFAEASRLAYPDREPAALSIKATAKGSFEAHLILEAKHVWDQVSDIFGSNGVTAIVNLKELVLSAGGLFWLIQKIRGRRIAKREQTPPPGGVKLTLEDGTVLQVSADVLRLYDRVSIRKKARGVVSPLGEHGIDAVRFESGDEKLLSLEGSDLSAFEVIEEHTPLGEQARPAVLQIASVAFVDGNKWRVSDGANTFWAAMRDGDFLRAVEQGEPFSKGDMLRCDLHIRQSMDADGALHAEYEILRVLEHIPRLPQLTFEMPEQGDKPDGRHANGE